MTTITRITTAKEYNARQAQRNRAMVFYSERSPYEPRRTGYVAEYTLGDSGGGAAWGKTKRALYDFVARRNGYERTAQ